MWIPNLPVTIASAVCATAGAVCIFKDMYSGAPFDKHLTAEDKVVVVTGATSGIGKEVAWDFARRGAKVFMACRDMEKCETVRRDIVLETSNKYVYCRPCDLASTQSVREYKSEEPRCNILVNNAGVMEPPQGVTRDGFEVQLGVNHLSHFLLTNLMLDTLKDLNMSEHYDAAAAYAQSKLANVLFARELARRTLGRGSIHTQDLNMSEHYDAAGAYAQSKLANVLFARELARRTLGRGTIHTQDLNMSEHYDAAAAYAQSKLANVLFARELARRTLGRGNIHTQDLNMSDHYDAAAAYAQSKVANVLFARELARRMLGRGTIHTQDLNMSEHYDAAAAYAQSKLANVLLARELARRTLGMSPHIYRPRHHPHAGPQHERALRRRR
ncbi:Short-chain dehydrogenase, partial [Operophtera brumata]